MQQKTKDRLAALSNIVADNTASDEIPLKLIEEELAPFYNGKRPELRSLKVIVEHYNLKPDKKSQLEIGPKGIILSGHPDGLAQLSNRKRKASVEKDAIANCLAHWLFDETTENADDPPLPLSQNFPLNEGVSYRGLWTSEQKISANLGRKRAILRSRTVVSMLIDAGTSTLSFSKKILSAPRLPLQVKSSQSINLLEPSITTNSLEIANEVSRSPNRRGMTLKVIGGTERPDRGSLSGEMALAWARTMKSMGMLDLSVIGTTGINTTEDGHLTLYMDEELECELKALFLEIANLRVVICDSSKILSGSYLNKFSQISLNRVDLIVIDDGKDIYQNKDSPYYNQESTVNNKLEKFIAHATEQGVGVMQVSVDIPENFS